MLQLAGKVVTPISIDCIKQCPFEPNLYAMAFYQTNPDTAGGIAVKKVTQTGDIQKIEMTKSPPLLHLLWVECISEPEKYMVVATSREDVVLFYGYHPGKGELQCMGEIKVGDGVFLLYVDAAVVDGKYHLVISTNDSTVIELWLDPHFAVLARNNYKGHEFAVWTCRLDPHRPDCFTCGDQVSTVYLYQQGQLLAKNSKAHQAGICDLTYGPAPTLYSGGFDGAACQFDLRQFHKPVHTQDYGGTVWRVIPDKAYERVILCNSSQNKFQVVSADLQKELWSSQKAHQSLAYAADWGNGQLLTASFYDKTVALWKQS